MAPSDVFKCDVLVVGTGAGGLSSAITARSHGLDVVIIEKSDRVGGTTARSGGGMWIPCNPLEQDAAIPDSMADATAYLRGVTKSTANAWSSIEAYLENGPRMIEFFQNQTSMKFLLQSDMPDYHLDIPGHSLQGRTVYAAPFDARELGEWRGHMNAPLRELTLFGIAIQRTDIRHFFSATRSLRSLAYVTRRLIERLYDKCFYGRSVRLVNGNALVARLLKSALEMQIPIWRSCEAKAVWLEDGVVRGCDVVHKDKAIRIDAARATVLACGGFSHDELSKRDFYRHVQTGSRHYSAADTIANGDGLRLGKAAGGRVTDPGNAGYWTPVSLFPRRDGTISPFPHSSNGGDRGKPGFIAVSPAGKRFTNEAVTYHDFVQAMFREGQTKDGVHAYLLCDHRAIRRYGMGAARPFPVPLGRHLKSGYIVSGRTIQELAARIGIDPTTLGQTVAWFNTNAREGHDPDFGRGQNVYHWFQGDLAHKPNPSLAPLERAPFYALKVVPGDVTTLAGLATDAHARVLKGDEVVPQLYAVGSDMMSIFGGHTPGAGMTLGPAMVFGYIAGNDIAGRA